MYFYNSNILLNEIVAQLCLDSTFLMNCAGSMEVYSAIDANLKQIAARVAEKATEMCKAKSVIYYHFLIIIILMIKESPQSLPYLFDAYGVNPYLYAIVSKPYERGNPH